MSISAYLPASPLAPPAPPSPSRRCQSLPTCRHHYKHHQHHLHPAGGVNLCLPAGITTSTTSTTFTQPAVSISAYLPASLQAPPASPSHSRRCQFLPTCRHHYKHHQHHLHPAGGVNLCLPAGITTSTTSTTFTQPAVSISAYLPASPLAPPAPPSHSRRCQSLPTCRHHH